MLFLDLDVFGIALVGTADDDMRNIYRKSRQDRRRSSILTDLLTRPRPEICLAILSLNLLARENRRDSRILSRFVGS